MKTGRRTAIATGVLIAALAAGAASAQAPPGGGTPGGRTGRGGSGAPGGPGAEGRDPASNAAPGSVADVARFQLRAMEEDLKLASAQRGAWAAYADRVLKLADDVSRTRNAVRFPQGSAPAQLDFVAQTLRNRLAAIEDVVDAGKALYGVLTPEQQAIADARLARIPIPLLVPSQPLADGPIPGARPGDGAPAPSRGR